MYLPCCCKLWNYLAELYFVNDYFLVGEPLLCLCLGWVSEGVTFMVGYWVGHFYGWVTGWGHFYGCVTGLGQFYGCVTGRVTFMVGLLGGVTLWLVTWRVTFMVGYWVGSLYGWLLGGVVTLRVELLVTFEMEVLADIVLCYGFSLFVS